MLLVILLLPLALNTTVLAASDTEGLRARFRQPPEAAKPRGYWVWPHGNFDYSAIRTELAEFKAKGLGGVDIFDLGIRNTTGVIPPGPSFMSQEQVDGITFALEEAKRHGLQMGLIVSSSWNAGGTWTPPEYASMNLVVWCETNTGPMRYERVLPLPVLPDSFRKPYGTFPLHVPRDEQGRPLFRKEVAVLAYPLDEQGRVPDTAQVRLLQGQVSSEGKLTCDLPAGRWVVMRAVLANFGQRLWVPSARSQGLTMDHFSREATRHHFRTIMDRLEARTGPLENTSLERLYLASYEANAGVNWTPGFDEEFAQQNGYRLEPFLPALFGVVIQDRETTERFLHDYRKTISELFINNLYREASRLCRERGLLLCSEAGGPGAPLHDVPTEDLKALGAVDVMRGEFWNGRQKQLTPEGFEELQVVKPIASAAHIYGHRVVEMEAFTSTIHWQEGPAVFKPLADRAFCEGMTRVVYHTMTHNMPEAGSPGWTYQAGTHMGTRLTWWDLSQQLHTYLARCSAMLMEGRFVADVAYYCGGDIPNFGKPKHLRGGLGYGYDYDDINSEVLLKARVDRQGRIVLPSGMSYTLLVLPPGERRMEWPVMQHLENLVRNGATVIGNRPERTYGLRGYPKEERQLQELAARVWGESARTAGGEQRYGRGRVVVGRTEREILHQLGVSPDFSVWPAELQSQVDYIHRRSEREEIYFVRNASSNALHFEATFRVTGKQPELWDPVHGTMKIAAAFRISAEGTRLPLALPGHGSIFVVFRDSRPISPHVVEVRRGEQVIFSGHPIEGSWFEVTRNAANTLVLGVDQPGGYRVKLSNGSERSVTIARKPPIEMMGPWQVRFPHGWNVPVHQEFASLQSWTESTNAGTRAFSGVAVYTQSFEVPAGIAGKSPVLLDLGEVREVARVYLNGREVGLSSFAPHVLEVTDFLRAGENSLVIEVANTWLNRLIADDALPESERKTHTNLPGPVAGKRWKDALPQPSGLMGPVRLVFPAHVEITTR